MPQDTIADRLATSEPVSLTISELASWHQTKSGSRLLLPPIQRSVVWSNEQVINYWDSLLRGYPAGTMMVHRVGNDALSGATRKGRDANGITCEANEDDYQLFDGQQRMAAILLGLAKGQMAESRRLWIDLGIFPSKISGLKFQLRMTSTGQPFGYRADAPNQRIELGKRQGKWKEWRAKFSDDVKAHEAFADATGRWLIDAKCVVSVAEVCADLNQHGRDATISTLSVKESVIPEIVEKFIGALQGALERKVILQQVNTEIVASQEEYIRFFGRLGQGGTRLSDDELTYSIIKHQYPEIHDRLKAIIRGPAGRLAGEVDLVLAALRVAKTLAPWEQANDWEVVSRPNPTFVAELKDRNTVRAKFGELIPLSSHPGNGQNGTLEFSLIQIRKALSYHPSDCQDGLPTVLLARLPRELVDVLILFTFRRDSNQSWKDDECVIIRAVVLHWLLFVNNDGKAAWLAFQRGANPNWRFSSESVRNLVAEYEEEGVARVLPRLSTLPVLREEVERGGDDLRPWAERFKALDGGDDRKPGEALRVLSTNTELARRALMWLQRAYLTRVVPTFDPTSDRDEDLPFDLDHLVPHSAFGADWRICSRRLSGDVNLDNFRSHRFTVGNSLGNFRWLVASDNRSRQDNPYVPLSNNDDLVTDPDAWNKIIPASTGDQPWSKAEVGTFQRLIDLRTLDLYKELLTKSGLEKILPSMAVPSGS